MAGKKYLAQSAGNIIEEASIQSSAGAGDAGKVVALDSAGKIDNSMMPTGIGAETKLLAASENLSAGDFVNIYDDAGTTKCRKADASTNKRADGFVLAAVTTGNNATVYTEGINNQLSGLTGGSYYFLSGATPGGSVTTAPSTSGHIVQEVGKALSATEISFEPSKPITLA